MAPRFGTDGVRAKALVDLTVDDVRRIGFAASRTLDASCFYVGRDTRESGPLLEEALVEGLAASGAEIRTLGVAPTPALAHLCAADGAAGAVISASHNPWYDNGIKLFDVGGRKLADLTQDRIQGLLDSDESAASGAVVGRVDASGEIERYERSLFDTFHSSGLSDRQVIIDCANGANHAVAPRVLRRLGVDPVVLFDEPDGRNINEGCGSTDLEPLIRAVRERPGSIGFAFDGDADRVLAVDERGQVVDGDRIVALCARHMQAAGRLPDDTVVVTVMANLGFHLAMQAQGIRVEATPVGDRHVLEALDAGGFGLGGEQSGHVIFRAQATTGDGLLTALHVLEVVASAGTTLAELSESAFTQVPQVLENVECEGHFDATSPVVVGAIAAAEERLGDRGRVLIRPSGTEPLVRIMIESLDQTLIEPIMTSLRAAVVSQTGH